jgi:hypothetical protein
MMKKRGIPSGPGCSKSANKVTESTDGLMWEGNAEFGMGPDEEGAARAFHESERPRAITTDKKQHRFMDAK